MLTIDEYTVQIYHHNDNRHVRHLNILENVRQESNGF